MEDLLKQWEAAEDGLADISRARGRFAPRPFHQRWKRLRRAANTAAAVLPAVSVATGLASLAAMLGLFVPFPYLCWALALPLLVLWEKGKSLLIGTLAEESYRSGKVPVLLAVLALLFAAGSGFFSVQGALELGRMADRTAEDASALLAHQKDSVVAEYGQLLQVARKERDAYLRANSYNGVVTYSRDNRFARHYESLSARVAQLEAARADALQRLEASAAKSLEDTQNSRGRLLWAAVALVAVCELLILLANWYPVHFDWRVARQAATVAGGLEGRYTVDLAQLRAVVEGFALNAATSRTAPAPIGFRAGNTAETDEEALATDIRSGIRDYRLLMKRHRLNVAAVATAIKKYAGEEG